MLTAWTVLISHIILYDEHRPDSSLFRAHHRPQVCIINISASDDQRFHSPKWFSGLPVPKVLTLYDYLMQNCRKMMPEPETGPAFKGRFPLGPECLLKLPGLPGPSPGHIDPGQAFSHEAWDLIMEPAA